MQFEEIEEHVDGSWWETNGSFGLRREGGGVE